MSRYVPSNEARNSSAFSCVGKRPTSRYSGSCSAVSGERIAINSLPSCSTSSVKFSLSKGVICLAPQCGQSSSHVQDHSSVHIRYVITDFSAELVISKFKEHAEAEGDIYVPDYQRGLAWSDDKKSFFIESLLLRVPIPPVFFYEVEGRLEIVDGSQRIRTLVSFANDGFVLRGMEKLDALNGFEFSTLPLSVQRRLKNTPIRSYVLDQGTDESTRVDVFRRLNTSGKKLQDAEIRKGAFRGPFLDLVIECAASKLFVNVIRAAM